MPVCKNRLQVPQNARALCHLLSSNNLVQCLVCGKYSDILKLKFLKVQCLVPIFFSVHLLADFEVLWLYYHLYVKNSQHFLPSPGFFPKFQTHIPNYLLSMSTKISSKYLKLSLKLNPQLLHCPQVFSTCSFPMSIGGHSILPGAQVVITLESPLIPLFLSHATSEVLENPMGSMLKIYLESNHFSPPPLPHPGLSHCCLSPEFLLQPLNWSPCFYSCLPLSILKVVARMRLSNNVRLFLVVFSKLCSGCHFIKSKSQSPIMA